MSRQGDARTPTIDTIRDFWNAEAEEWGDSPRVTIRDHFMRLLEIATVTPLVEGRGRVLDIGCGTGLSTLFYAPHVGEIVGADFADKMVRWAERLLGDEEYFRRTMAEYAPDGAPPRTGNVTFEQGDILDLDYDDGSFDAVVGERVLINLPSYELQERAIGEVARVLASGGRYVMVEVTLEGHADMDRVRGEMGLGPIEKYWHNLYVDEAGLTPLAGEWGLEIAEIVRFETYQFLSKVVHPLVVAPEEPRFLAGFNDAARRVALERPSHASVREVGLERFLVEEFRPLLAEHDPGKLTGYDRVVERVLEVAPDFGGCSHQVLFRLEKA